MFRVFFANLPVRISGLFKTRRKKWIGNDARLGKRYKNTHQKQLLLHQRCPQLFLLPRGECLFSVLSLFLIGGRCRIVFSRDWISKREERGRRGKEKKKRWRGLFLNRARSCVDLNRKPRAWWFLVHLFYAWSANERRGRVFLFEYPIVGIFKKEWERENSTESLSLSNCGRRGEM